MASPFYTKTQAIAVINMETGYGQRVIAKTMNKLLEQGRIKILEAPDGRVQRFTRADVDLIIKVLKGEIE